jgi:hypothetical protein
MPLFRVLRQPFDAFIETRMAAEGVPVSLTRREPPTARPKSTPTMLQRRKFSDLQLFDLERGGNEWALAAPGQLYRVTPPG